VNKSATNLKRINHQLTKVSVLVDESGPFAARSRELAEKLQLPVIEAMHTSAGMVLVSDDAGLALHDTAAPRSQPLRISFSSQDLRPYGPNLSRRQPLARAIGKKNRTVVDATAGLGQDAFLLAAMGYTVTAVERSPILAMLLSDAVARAADEPRLVKALGGRLHVVFGDSIDVIPTLLAADVVYLDPMFPPKRSKSALPKREMVLLRKLVGEDPDAGQLFENARRHAANRVVVKRPNYAPPLAARPDFSQTGKLVRYDVYLC
jgi:16S rRNA (guanine1516-N2)-methyltransferase